MKRKVMGWLAAIAVASLPLAAQQQSGDTELQLQGSLSLATSSQQQDDQGGVNVKAGRFFTQSQEIGLELNTNLSGRFHLSGGGGPFYRYNFGGRQVVPYLGASIDGTFGSGGGNNGQLTLEGGLRYFLDRRTSFDVEGSTSYSLQSHQYSKVVQILFGFSRLWGG